MKITIPVNQQIDEVGGEFLDERDFEIEVSAIEATSDYVVCVIDSMPNCYIKKSNIIALASALKT